MDDWAAQTLHGRREGAAGASADFIEHGRHHLTLDSEEQGASFWDGIETEEY